MSKEDDERFWNLIIYKMWATDAEMAEILPVLGVIGLVIFVVVVGAFLWKRFF